MYFCNCKGISLDVVKKALEQSADLTQLMEIHGLGTGCGMCLKGLTEVKKGPCLLNNSKKPDTINKYSKQEVAYAGR